MKADSKSDFGRVARRAIHRLVLAQWLGALGRSAPVVYAAAIALAVVIWARGIYWIDTTIAVSIVAAWLLATAAWAWLQRPSAIAAMAIWDERTGRGEMFTSAYCFEAEEKPSVGERLHLARAARRLEEDLPAMPRDLPIPVVHRAWILPTVFVALAGLLLAAPIIAVEPPVGDEARAGAIDVAAMLDKRPALHDVSKELTQEEEDELKKLDESLDETAEKLRNLNQETRSDVLAELERRAHEAEKLADALDVPDGELLSSKMLAELERHADTTDFASSVRAKALEKAAEESRKLERLLKQEDLSLEQRKRIEQALKKSLEAANKADKQSVVGKHLQQAHQGLQAKKPALASKQFAKLAKHFQKIRQRQQAKRQLQQLTKQLRNAGQQIFGQKPAAVRRLATPPSGLRQLGAAQLKAANAALQQRLAGTPQAQLAQAGTGQLFVPQPAGKTPQGKPGQGMAPVPGSKAGQPKPGTPRMLMPGGKAPVPGTLAHMPGQGQNPGSGQKPGGGQMPGSGQTPIPGTGQGQGQGMGQGQSMAQGQGAGVGGHFAGHGTAAYGNTATKPHDATTTALVNAQISGEGPSRIRQIEKGPHREETRRSSRELAIDFIKTEEAALAEEPLPLSRREQVLRYFTALRRQLVEQPVKKPE